MVSFTSRLLQPRKGPPAPVEKEAVRAPLTVWNRRPQTWEERNEQVAAVSLIETSGFLKITQYRVVEIDRRFGGIYCLYHQVIIVSFHDTTRRFFTEDEIFHYRSSETIKRRISSVSGGFLRISLALKCTAFHF
jgi:hypothetical protein